MTMSRLKAIAAVIFAFVAAPAAAGELFGGVYAQGIESGLVNDIGERGAAFQLGYRGGPLLRVPRVGELRPHVFGSVNTDGKTNFAAAGLSLRLGGHIYARPGIGLAIHDAPGRAFRGDTRSDFGSRVLFTPELAIGVEVAPRMTLEASYVHLSHGQIFSGQNPGLDVIGLRLNIRLR